MQVFRRRDQKKHRRLRTRVALSRSNKLLVEPLEWRGMLSVTVGSLADEVAAGTFAISEPSADTTSGGEQLICTCGFASVDSLSDPSSVTYSIDPPDFELPPDAPVDGGVDPVIIVDPVVVDPELPPDCELPPAEPGDGGIDPVIIVDPVVDPVVVEPIDLRVQFVSSDVGWAAYYYWVGSDGVVQGVSVVASYDEPTIAAFVADHRDDPSVQMNDGGDCWVISGFPLEMAPPVPDQPNYLTWGSVDDAVAVDEPALDGGDESSNVGDQPITVYDGPFECGLGMDGPTDAAGQSGLPAEWERAVPVAFAFMGADVSGSDSMVSPPAPIGGESGSVDVANFAAAAASLGGGSGHDAAEATVPPARRRAR